MVPAKSATAAGVSVTLLGPPVLRCAGLSRELLPERRSELLAHLAYRGDWISRDALAFMFWPDQDNSGARRNLRWVLHSAREMPGSAAIEAERDRIRFHVATDVRDFEAAVREERWAAAVALYEGTLCSGLDAEGDTPFARWLRHERGRLVEMFHRAALALIGSVGPREVVALARRLIAYDPADEDALRAGVRALHALGEDREARRLYREFAERLMDELGLEPAAETRALVHELERPAVAPTAPRPIESKFVGRERELAEIAALLAHPGCRLLTLIGPGGVGKSRLAREAVIRHGSAPTTLVALEALTLPAQFAPEVARAVGVRIAPGDDPGARVLAHFASRQHLLVCDNFEHVIDAAEQLARWLADCPNLQVVVTSRERLGIAGEWLLPVEGLGVPGAGDEIGASDAVRLFMDRAVAVRYGFDRDAEEADVARIVAQVDGMPLAIELAAAWVRLLPCADIARDLEQGLELFESSADAPPHQLSVRASFEHSWSLLMARERSLFARLAVFHGGFEREAARQIADTGLPAIAQLVDKSLVRANGAGRFALHPLLRQFAAEKLAAAGEEEATRQRHAEYFAHWMERLAAQGKIDLATALPKLDAEIFNCVAAWDWAVAHERADLLRAACLVLAAYFERRGRLREGLEHFARADALPASAPGYDAALGNVNRSRATLMMRLGRYEDADRHARDALRHFKVTRDAAGIKSALTTLGLSHWQRARYAQAQRYLAEGLRRCRADGDRGGEAGFLVNLALIAKADGRYPETESLLAQAIVIFREIGDEIRLISALSNLGNLCRSLREPARGRDPLREALAISERTGDAITLPFIVINLALIELELGNLDAARRYCERALAIVAKGADRQIEVGCHATLARIELARGAVPEARRHLRTSAVIARELGHTPLLLGAAVNAASTLRLEGRHDDAAAVLFMVRAHPAAAQPDRDDVERELAALRPALSDAALDAARARSGTLQLDAVIAEAIAASPEA